MQEPYMHMEYCVPPNRTIGHPARLVVDYNLQRLESVQGLSTLCSELADFRGKST